MDKRERGLIYTLIIANHKKIIEQKSAKKLHNFSYKKYLICRKSQNSLMCDNCKKNLGERLIHAASIFLIL